MKATVIVSLLLAAAAAAIGKHADDYYSAYFDAASKTWAVRAGKDGIAAGFYRKSLNETGWDVLEIETDGSSDDDLQAFGAGYLEGYLSAPFVWDFWQSHNWSMSDASVAFIQKNDAWVRATVANPPAGEADYWTHVGLVYAQFDGIVAGYQAAAPADQQLTPLDFVLYMRYFELGDYICAVGECAQMKTLRDFRLDGHCSVLVKPLPDLSNIYHSHDTWGSYFSMVRTFKHITTSFKSVATPAPKVSFSSRPGMLESGDDFYITSQNLVITETTNSVFNLSLYANVTTQQVPYWARNVVANRMATDGPSWVNVFSMYNSGTYSNQWQVSDMKLFTPWQPLQDGLLWIAEQIPGYVISSDVTDILRTQGYFPSYNVPYFKWVYDVSGYPENIGQMGQELSYTNCSRANIFRRDQHTVADMASMQNIMRYNEWQTDPFSSGNACNSISARCDLNPPSVEAPMPFGGYDSKVTDSKLSGSRSAWAVGGPSWQDQPVFAWTEQWQSYSHFGQPTVFDFEFEMMTPTHA